MTGASAPAPSGADLVDELRAAAKARGVSLNQMVAPLATSTPSNFLQCLGRSSRPMGFTIDKVRACCAGLPIPEVPAASYSGQRGVKQVEAADSEVRVPSHVIERRRRLAERAHAERRPGETLHQAVIRLAQQGESA
jgi:hypothetical protein